MDLLSQTDLELLENVIQPVCPALTETIHHYKAHYCKFQKILVANVYLRIHKQTQREHSCFQRVSEFSGTAGGSSE